MKNYYISAIIASTICFSKAIYAMDDSSRKEPSFLSMGQTFKLPMGKDYTDLENTILTNILPNDISPDTYRAISIDLSKLNELAGRWDFIERGEKPNPSLTWQGIQCSIGMCLQFPGIGGVRAMYAKDIVRISYDKKFQTLEGGESFLVSP